MTVERPVLLYDADCRVCRFVARATLRLDRRQELGFLPLQDPEAGRFLDRLPAEERLASWRLVRPDGSLAGHGAGLGELLGSMSVVGPRPHPVPLNLQSKDSVENYMMRHWVKPGITGWAQVKGYRGETSTPYLMQKRVELDLWYVENWTFPLDLQIIVQTLVNMVKGEENAF